jgi:hypothetical protein
MAARLGAGVSPRNGCRVWSGQGEGSTAQAKERTGDHHNRS